MDENLSQLIQQSEQLFNEKKYKEVIELLTDELLEQYNNAALYAWRARAHDWLNETTQVFLYADKAIEIDPSFPLPYIARGNAWSAKQEYDKAINDYSKAIDLDEKDVIAYNNRGLAWSAKQEYDKAIDDYSKAIALDKKDADAYITRGNAWVEKKEYDKAIGDYSEAIALDEKYAMAYSNRGNAWVEKKEYDKAIDDYSKAIALDEKDAIAYNGRGNEWYYKKEYDRAIDDYSKAIALDEKDAIAYNNRGNVWRAKKEYDKAMDDYSKVIASDEKNADAYYNRAVLYDEIQKLSEAKIDYEQYIRLKNDPKDYYSKVAQLNIKELEKRLANPWYNEISELVSKIKKLLLFEQACVTHYTGLSASKAMILTKSKLRLSEGAFLNDTSEGKELFKYLDFSIIKEKQDETLAEKFTEKPFIGSFVTETKHDDLTLWRMYGKEDKVEARGCALTLNKDRCLSELETAVSSKDYRGVSMQTDEQFTFYKVAYITKEGLKKIIIPGDNNSDELTGLMNELKTKLEILDNEQKTSVKELLNGIAYLFKSVEYQYENEVRLIVQGVGFEKTIDITANPPKVFIELIEMIPVLTRITFGPKVERADEWAAAFNYQIKKQIADSNIEIVISHLPFK